ncbi:MAG: DedA family protein [Helicobacteraceae bacterium]|nr:DedA family protein [Helicobacteraceae bacterium]
MEAITRNIETYGYIALFVYSLGGGFVGLVAAGTLAAIGLLDIAVTLIVAFAGNVAGDTILFYLARTNKKEVLRYLKKHRRKIALSFKLLKRWGAWIIVGQKFVYGLKTIIPIVVGFSGYRFWRFFALNLLGAALWAAVFGFGGFLAGDFFRRFAEDFGGRAYWLPIALFAVLGVSYLLLTIVTKRRGAKKSG